MENVVLRSTTRWSFGKTFQRGDGSDSAAQTLAAANAAAAAASMAADTIAAEAAVAVIVAAEVTQMAADKTAELKVATAAKTQVAPPLCCNIYTHPDKHTRTHKRKHASPRLQHAFSTHKCTEAENMRIHSLTSSSTLMLIYTNRENQRSERILDMFVYMYMHVYIQTGVRK